MGCVLQNGTSLLSTCNTFLRLLITVLCIRGQVVMERKRIGIEAGSWNNGRGYGRFTRELVSALCTTDDENDYCLFVDRWVERSSLPARAEFVVVPQRESPSRAASAAGY